MNTFNMFLKTSTKCKTLFCFYDKKIFRTSRINQSRKSVKCPVHLDRCDITKEKGSTDLIETKNVNLHNNDSQFIQHVFKWGIGNRFRSNPETRYYPVHLERPKEVTIKKSYFFPVNKNIIYEQLNEQWEVFWYEHNKLNAKPFPIKKYGIEAAKKEAIKFYELLKRNKQINEKPKYESGVEGVHFDYVTKCWVSFYRENNFPICKSFSAEFHGFETAKQMAIDRVKKYQK